MIAGARGGIGWQTTLADLALILFLVAASALDRQGQTAPPVTVPAQGTPAAMWHERAGAPPLAQWLAAEQRDPRLQLTLLAAPADGARALQLADGLPGARVVIEPSLADGQPGVVALLGYDRAP